MLKVLSDWLVRQEGIRELNLDVFESEKVKAKTVYGVCMRGKSGGVVFIDTTVKLKDHQIDTMLLYANGPMLLAFNDRKLFTNGRFSFMRPVFRKGLLQMINVLQPNGTELVWDVTLNKFI